MTWVESVRQQLADEGVPFGTTVTVSEAANGAARVHLFTHEPLCETFIEVRDGHPNVERAYGDAVLQHRRSVANLSGKGAA